MTAISSLVQFIANRTDPVGLVVGQADLILVNPAAAVLTGIGVEHDNLACFLSEGQRARITKLCAMIANPDLHIDEPLSIRLGIDHAVGSIEVWISAASTIAVQEQAGHVDYATLIRLRPTSAVGPLDPGDDGRSRVERGMWGDPGTTAADSGPDRLDGDGPLQSEKAAMDRLARATQMLSRSEADVLHRTLDGDRVSTIAAALFLSEHTIRNTLKRINRKLDVRSTAELREQLAGSMTTSAMTGSRTTVLSVLPDGRGGQLPNPPADGVTKPARSPEPLRAVPQAS